MPTVNLSALAGAGQQFFDNNGNPLSGGNLWSYQAGTTTPQTTYTSASGATAHTNPIVLDSAGRVATGEIWVTAGQNYKFVLMTSANVTIATWDNITGINGTGITSNANNVEYDPPFTGALTSGYTVENKLAQYISVKDFGATGDGVTDDTVAIQAAIAALGVLLTQNPNSPTYAKNPLIQSGGGKLFFPKGKYLVTDKLLYSGGMIWEGEDWGSYILFQPSVPNNCVQENTAARTWSNTQEGFSISNMYFAAGNTNAQIGLLLENTQSINLNNIRVSGFSSKNIFVGGTGGGGYYNEFTDIQLVDSPINLEIDGTSLNSGASTTIIGGAFYHTAGFTGAQYNVILGGEVSGTTFEGTSLEGQATIAQVLDGGRGTRFVNIYYEDPNGVPLVSRNFTKGLAGNTFVEPSAKASMLLTNFPQTTADSDAFEQFVPLTFFRGFPKAVPLIQNGNFSNGLLGWVRNNSGGTFGNGLVYLDSDVFYNSQGSFRFEASGTGNGTIRASQTIPGSLLTKYINQRLYFHVICRFEDATDSEFQLNLNGAGLGNKFSSSQAIKYNSGNYAQFSINNPIVTATDLTLTVDFTSATAGRKGWVYGVWTTIGGQDFLAPLSEDLFPLNASPSTSAFGTWNVADQVQNNEWVLTEPLGWICSQAGTNGTLGSVTCDTTNLSTSVTNISSTVNLGVGMYITIAGVTGVKKITALSGTTATIDSAADATTTGAAVSYSNAVFKNLFTPS